MMRILVVEDDDRIADFLVRALNSEGNHCVRSSDGAEGLALAREADFDLIILDLMLPVMPGLDVCQELRTRGIRTPIIILTAMGGVEDIITGLKMGADDYITKPFVIDVLLARIDAVVRRVKPEVEEDPVMMFGDIQFNRRSMEVIVAEQRIDLSPKELAILELLISNPDRLFSRERILSNVWGMDIDPLTNVVDVYIGKLRKKISHAGTTPVIETVRGLGYKLTNKK